MQQQVVRAPPTGYLPVVHPLAHTPPQQPSTKEDLEIAFKAFDKDGSGSISKSELRYPPRTKRSYFDAFAVDAEFPLPSRSHKPAKCLPNPKTLA